MIRYLIIPLLIYSFFGGKLYAVMDSAMESFSSKDFTSRDTQNYSEAESQGSHFLTLIDQEQYASAWDDAGLLLQDLVSQKIWVEGIRAVRHPLGQVIARKRESHDEVGTIGGNVKGFFYRVNYRTQFYGGTSRRESLLLVGIGLGQWRVISYSLE